MLRFLLARLHVESLESAAALSIRHVRKRLQNLPATLVGTYDEAMQRIENQEPDHKDIALKTLAWVSYAFRSLSLKELQHALAIEPGDTELDEELVVAGRAAWQVLAGAAGGRRMHGRLLCMSAPYGVTYLVASWDEPRPDLCHRPHRTPVTCRGKRWLRSGHAVREGTRHRERLRDPARPR